MNDIILRRNAFLSIGPMRGFVYPLFFGVIERAGVHVCPDVYTMVAPYIKTVSSLNEDKTQLCPGSG